MTDGTTPIRERARRALERAKAATEGAWYADAAISGDGSVVMSEHTGMRVAHLPWTTHVLNDAEFIAAAREDIPALSTFALRITSPEMRERIAQTIRDVDRGQRLWGADVQDLTTAIFALITEETP